MRVRKSIFMGIVLVMMSASCTITKPYVGYRVNPQYPLMAYIDNFPASVVLGGGEDAFSFDVQIYKTKTENEYRLTGGMTAGGDGMGNFRTLETATFQLKLLLISKGVVMDTVALNPLGSDLDHRMPFKKTFKSEPFDSIAMVYSGSVSG